MVREVPQDRYDRRACYQPNRTLLILKPGIDTFANCEVSCCLAGRGATARGQRDGSRGVDG